MSRAEVARRATLTSLKPSSKALARRDSAAEIEQLLKSRGVVPLAEKALSVGEEIGKGKFKTVHKGLLRQQCGGEPRDVVIMQYKKQGSEVNELSVLSLLEGMHEFVPELFGVVDQCNMVSLVQECAAHGTLKSALQSPNLALQITQQHKLHMANTVALGLDFLQTLRIVHADLACRNLLLFHLDQDPTSVCVKITDFGLAIVLGEGSVSQRKKQPQATRWCSPETVASNKYSYQSDIWSLGVCLWELFSNAATPWIGYDKRADVTALLTKLSEHPGPTDRSSLSSAVLPVAFPLPSVYCVDAYALILECLNVDAEARPTAAQVAERFQGILVDNATLEGGIVQSGSESTSEFSDANVDEVGSMVSTEAPAAPTPSELPLSMTSLHVSKPCLESTHDESISTPQEECTSSSELKLVSDFLWSPYALSVLGEAAVQKMRQEVVQAHEAQKAQEFACRSTKSHACDTLQQANAPLRDLLLSPRQTQGSLRCWKASPPLSIWTLWSDAENDKLRRQDFGSEAAARAAAQAHGKRSRVLRGLYHEEVYTGVAAAIES